MPAAVWPTFGNLRCARRSRRAGARCAATHIAPGDGARLTENDRRASWPRAEGVMADADACNGGQPFHDGLFGFGDLATSAASTLLSVYGGPTPVHDGSRGAVPAPKCVTSPYESADYHIFSLDLYF